MGRIETTRWSLILRAAGDEPAKASLALALLCEAYWYPVYAFVRRQGYAPADAEDLTQGYFARFLEKGVVREVRPEYGRFRSFLFASVRHFLSNERDRERAQKRGGGRRLVSLDADEAERAYERTPVDATTPETVFERSWARAVFDRVLERLVHEAAPGDGRERVLRLRPFLTGAEPSSSFADIAREWGVGGARGPPPAAPALRRAPARGGRGDRRRRARCRRRGPPRPLAARVRAGYLSPTAKTRPAWTRASLRFSISPKTRR
jgi:RNA polymerase sigma-70 factor (ECF subfamily)